MPSCSCRLRSAPCCGKPVDNLWNALCKTFDPASPLTIVAGCDILMSDSARNTPDGSNVGRYFYTEKHRDISAIRVSQKDHTAKITATERTARGVLSDASKGGIMGEAEHQPNASANIDNDRFSSKINNEQCRFSLKTNNDNVITMLEVEELNRKNRSRRNTMRVDSLADMLVDKFRAPASRNFFCKCAWNLSDDEIWSTFERANKTGIEKPINYFVRSCSEMMKKKRRRMQH